MEADMVALVIICCGVMDEGAMATFLLYDLVWSVTGIYAKRM